MQNKILPAVILLLTTLPADAQLTSNDTANIVALNKQIAQHYTNKNLKAALAPMTQVVTTLETKLGKNSPAAKQARANLTALQQRVAKLASSNVLGAQGAAKQASSNVLGTIGEASKQASTNALGALEIAPGLELMSEMMDPSTHKIHGYIKNSTAKTIKHVVIFASLYKCLSLVDNTNTSINTLPAGQIYEFNLDLSYYFNTPSEDARMSTQQGSADSYQITRITCD